MPHIKVLGTGGTIASTGGDSGATPSKQSDELLNAVPEIGKYADISVEQVTQVPSFDLDTETLATFAQQTQSAADEGIDGVVVTHGTDTMETSAYYLDLTLDCDIPVVFTGAQRRPDELSPDGPANLRTAVRAVTHDRFRNHGGVYVAFNQQVHAARDVVKMHTTALETFRSPEKGPVATITRETVRLFRQPGSRSVDIPVLETDSDVAMVKSGVGIDGSAIIDARNGSVDGIVLEGTGLGNTTAALGNAIADTVDTGIPVVVTSRCPAGSVTPVYGTDGGGKTLAEHGAIFGDDLPAHKARIKLMLACEVSDSIESVREYFE